MYRKDTLPESRQKNFKAKSKMIDLSVSKGRNKIGTGAGLVRVSPVAAKRCKDGTDLVRHPDVLATTDVSRPYSDDRLS